MGFEQKLKELSESFDELGKAIAYDMAVDELGRKVDALSKNRKELEKNMKDVS